MKIYICGFSGAGKSTLGKILAKDVNFGSYDLDEEIFNRYESGQEHLGEYIEEVGMDVFREDEVEMLKLLHQNLKDNYAITLGGGALETKEIRDFISSVEGKLVFLDIPFDTCWQRLASHNDRPLAKKGENHMRELYDTRRAEYEKAHVILKPEDIEKIETLSDFLAYLN